MLNEFNNEKNEEIFEALPEVEVVALAEDLELKEDLNDNLDNKEESIPEPQIEEPVVKEPAAEKKLPSPSKEVKKSEKVAVHSTRNVTWHEVGKVYIGYNIVTPEAAEKWLTRDHIRLATPQEVAKEFGI